MAEWKFRRRQGWCGACERAFEEEERHMSALGIVDGDLVRQDHCLACWEEREEDPDAELFWWSTRHQPDRKATLALDLESLERLFLKLEGRTEQQICELRYVLSLLLMRKRRLKLERVVREGDREEMICSRPKREERYHVAVYDFSADRIDELRTQLAEVFEGFDPEEEEPTAQDAEADEPELEDSDAEACEPA